MVKYGIDFWRTISYVINMVTTAQKPQSSATSQRRHKQDYLDGGLSIIAQDGHAEGVTIARICAYLGVSKGSFYWHFHNRDDFVRALYDHWATSAHGHHYDRIAAEAGGDLRRLLSGLLRYWDENRYGAIDRALRRWAESDPTAKQAVEIADKALMKFVTRAFRDAGHKKKEAARRARLLIGVGIAEPTIAHIPRPGVPLDELIWLLDFLTA